MGSRASDAPGLAVCGPAFLGVVVGLLDGLSIPGRETWVGRALMYAGGVTNQAVTLACLGMPVRLRSRVGVDRVGVFVDRMFAYEGVNASSCERVGDQNVTVSLSFDSDHVMTTRGTTALPLLDGDAPACLLADVWGVDANNEVVFFWRVRGIWVLAGAAWDETGARNGADLEPLLLADVYTPNEEEALVHARTKNMEDATRWFASFECGCVVTCGKSGVIVYVGRRILRVSAPAVDAVGTMDAEDVFLTVLTWTYRAHRMS